MSAPKFTPFSPQPLQISEKICYNKAEGVLVTFMFNDFRN
jgi:hypothetical protein